MNELLPVNNDTQKVSARDLHKAVGSTERFSTWFERQLQFGFVENEDYTSVKSFTVVNNGAERELQDYDLTVDMAKQICMVQKNEKAREVRQYLIDLEKAWNSPDQVMARALKVADQTINSLSQRITEMQPKADYFDALVDRNLNTLPRDTAKELGIKEKNFVKFLIDRGYCYRQSGQLRPYSPYCEGQGRKGLFVIKDVKNERTGWVGQQMYITPKGKETFRLLLNDPQIEFEV